MKTLAELKKDFFEKKRLYDEGISPTEGGATFDDLWDHPWHTAMIAEEKRIERGKSMNNEWTEKFEVMEANIQGKQAMIDKLLAENQRLEEEIKQLRESLNGLQFLGIVENAFKHVEKEFKGGRYEQGRLRG